MCITHQDKVTIAIAAEHTASLDEMVQTVTNTFYNREGSQGTGEGEMGWDKSRLDAGCPPGKPYGKPWVLEGQGSRQVPNL